MFKSTKNKFMASAAAAALTVAAIAPVAGAEEVKANKGFLFSDVSPESSHFEAIYVARDYKMLSGYLDGTFKPSKSLTRSNVIKALGKYVVAQSGKSISDFNLTNVEPFNDVPATSSDKELFTYSLIVKQAGIFSGDKNNLMPTNLMTRQQIAKVLVEAFDLTDLSGVESKVTDNSKASNQAYREYINILSENGVTTETVFRPRETTSRAQLASFLTRSYKVAHKGEETPVEAIAKFEAVMGNFDVLSKEYGVGIAIDSSAENTFTLTVPTQLPEVEAGGTGFFEALAEQGIKTIAIEGKTYTVSDGKGNVSANAADIKAALLAAVALNDTMALTVYIPYGDAAAVTTVTYKFNIAS